MTPQEWRDTLNDMDPIVARRVERMLASERAAHAAEGERLMAERDEARAIVRALDEKHDDGCEVIAVIGYDCAAGTTTTRKPDPIPEWRRRT